METCREMITSGTSGFTPSLVPRPLTRGVFLSCERPGYEASFTPSSLSISALVCACRKCAAVVDILYLCVRRKNLKTLKCTVYLYLHYGATFVGIMIFPECAHMYTVYSTISLPYSAPDRSRLRLAAASGLLKLAQSSHYQELITLEQFQRLALTMQVRLAPLSLESHVL